MTDARGRDWPLYAVTLAALILALPLWCVQTPAMPDYPAHYATFALIGGAPSLYYRIVWDFLPNLAFEALVPPLAHLLSLNAATKLLLTVTVFLWVTGPALIQRALFGKVQATALLGALFAYNANFMWGFFNYTFAAGLDFVVIAAWIATARRRTVLREVGFAVAFTLIYFSHLFAFLMLVLVIGSLELSAWPEDRPRSAMALFRRMLRLILLCLPALFAFFALKPGAHAGLDLDFNLLQTAGDRFDAAIQYGFDRPATVVIAVLLAAWLISVAARRARVDRRLCLALALLLLGAAIAPEWALGGWAVHLRLPAFLGALLFASTELRLSGRWQTAIGGIALAGCAAIASAVTIDWTHYDVRFREFLSHPGDIRAGARLMTVMDGDSIGWAPEPPYWHIGEFAIATRGVFTPLMFATEGQHVVQIDPPYRGYAATTAQEGSPPDIDELDDLAAGQRGGDEDLRDIFRVYAFFQCHFDEAVVVRGDRQPSRIPAMLRLKVQRQHYSVYEIVPDARCRKS